MKKIVFIACTPVGRYMIEEVLNNRLIKKHVKISGIVNLNKDVALSKSNYDSYEDLKQKYNLEIYYCKNVNEPECIDFIKSKNPELIIQSGWSQKFSNQLLNIPKYMCIGEHPAPLPVGRGAACVNWAILKGYTRWGDTFFHMNSEYDSGDILAQEFFDIMPIDDVKTIYDKVCCTSKNIIRNNLLNWLDGEFNSYKQKHGEEEVFKRRTPEDGLIDFKELTASQVEKLVRAVTKPYPGAYFITNNHKKIYVWNARKVKDSEYAQEYKVTTNQANGSIVVECKLGYIELIRVQEENHPEMWGLDWYFGNESVFS